MKSTLCLALVWSALCCAPALAWSPDTENPDWPISSLGRTCADLDAAARTTFEWFCDARGRVAGVGMPVDFLHVTSLGTPLIVWNDGSPLRHRAVEAYERSGVLILRYVSCGGCARVMGDGYVFDLAGIAASDLTPIQVRLGVPRVPLLRTASAWRAALVRVYPPRN